MFAVGDQLAVVGRDLAAALETAPSQELDEAVRYVGEAAARGFRVSGAGARTSGPRPAVRTRR